MDYAENAKVADMMPLSVTSLCDHKDAFSALLGPAPKKQVISFTDNDEGRVVKVLIRSFFFSGASYSHLSQSQLKDIKFAGDKTYIITGGLGGLGCALAVWLASHGARHIVLMTSSPSRILRFKNFLDSLQAYGCEAKAVVCNVAEMASVSRVVASIETPIAGVIHSALKLSVWFMSHALEEPAPS